MHHIGPWIKARQHYVSTDDYLRDNPDDQEDRIIGDLPDWFNQQ